MYDFMRFALPIILLVIMAIVIFKSKRSCMKKGSFDERQQFMRGKAYKSAFFVLIFYLLIAGWYDLCGCIIWCDRITESFIGICLSATVFAIQCVLSDAYMSLKEKPAGIISLFSAIGIINLVLGIINLSQRGYAFSNGVLNFRSINFFAGITILIILTVFIAKLQADKKVKAE